MRRRENAVAYVRWVQTLFPGVDISSRRTLAFSDDAKEALCGVGLDGHNLALEVEEGGRGGDAA